LGGGRQPRSICWVSPPRPSPDPVLAHHVRRCFCTQVPHITAEGRLRLSSVVGGRSVAGVDTYPYFSTQISSSRLRPRRLIQHMGAWTNLAGATTSCLHPRVQFPWLSASGITLSRGVGKRMDVRSTFWGGSGVSRYPGSSDEWQGTGTRTPRGRKRQKKPNHRKVPRFFPGRLAFDGRDTSLLPTPGVLNIYMTLG
jgi:hypothetical protein